MEEIKTCCICGKNTEKIYEIGFKGLLGLADEYTEKIGYCSECGFLFNSNPFSEEQLEKRYKLLSKYEYENKIENFIERKDFITRSKIQKTFIQNNCKEQINSVFEIGAATGYNLNLYKEEGKKVFGIEPSRMNKEIAYKKYGVDLYDDTYQNYLKSQEITEKYDLIFLSNVLEHIVNPMKCILDLSKLSSKYIFIEVPTFDYKLSDEVYGMFSDEHVNYFTFQSIQKLMSKANYHLVNSQIEFYLDCYVPSGTPSLMTIWEKNDKNVEYKELKIINNSKNSLEEYIKDSEEKLKKIKQKIDTINNTEKIAVWGTGNHTARLLASTDLKNKNIVKFYDSDIKKHDYKIMGRKITSFDINDILSESIEKIVISSYVSQNAIIESIKDIVPIEKIIYFYDR